MPSHHHLPAKWAPLPRNGSLLWMEQQDNLNTHTPFFLQHGTCPFMPQSFKGVLTIRRLFFSGITGRKTCLAHKDFCHNEKKFSQQQCGSCMDKVTNHKPCHLKVMASRKASHKLRYMRLTILTILNSSLGKAFIIS